MARNANGFMSDWDYRCRCLDRGQDKCRVHKPRRQPRKKAGRVK
jgi:hypothetical protein